MSLPAIASNNISPPGAPVDSSQNTTVLFTPITTKSSTAHNRIVVSPMCMYSADNGYMNDFHHVHLGSFALKGAGTVIIEATAVEPRGRISPSDLGLWEDGQMAPLKKIVAFIKAQGAVSGIQLAHAGRKASMGAPFIDYRLVPEEEGGWPDDVVGPSAIPYNDHHAKPRALTVDEMKEIKQKWVDAAIRADKAGVETMMIHAAHGYLLNSFLSGNSNQRTDEYGGSLENRLRYPLEVVKAVREVWPADKPFWVRISASDHKNIDVFAKDDQGWDIFQSIEFAKELKKLQVDVIDCSTGGNLTDIQYPAGPLWQVPFAEAIKQKVGIRTSAVGIITKGNEAEDILQENKADFVSVAREFLRDSAFVLTAARDLGVNVTWPKQYFMANRAGSIFKGLTTIDMRKPVYSLTRKLARMSWNKYNLFNIAEKQKPHLHSKTLFQQKWLAKRETRAYHGDEITEKQFKTKFFDAKLPTVNAASQTIPHPPVSVLTFAELERRLDFVVFRSNFCSSIYAARQLCVHGKVLVNGKKFTYPSHKLKDGDMISVDPQAIQLLKGEKGAELSFELKPFSQPFLFVPEYLEVNYNTCQTVFLRSPISRPGRSEIPSPYAPDLHSLAYEYYARNK